MALSGCIINGERISKELTKGNKKELKQRLIRVLHKWIDDI